MIVYQDKKGLPDYSNKKFEDLKGYLTEESARASLGEFLFNNLGIAVDLLFGGDNLNGFKIFPYQELFLRAWFENSFNLNVWSRGGGKSYNAAIFCCLYPIFNPGHKIVIASNAFRSTRRMILQIEKFINMKGATLLKQCFCHNKKGKLEFVRRADEMIMEVNEGAIIALPLNEKIRGTRADVLIVDEFLMVPEDIYKGVLMPFLMAKSNIQEQLQMQELEDMLIASGDLSEDQRTILGSAKKIIGLTSASYDFEFVYRLYKEWIGNVVEPKESKRTYFVSRIGYEAFPEALVEKEIVEEAAAGGKDSPHFQRECMSIFSSSSDGYFNIKKLNKCTIKDGEMPCIELRGDPKSEYMVTIDPSFSDSKSSDFFAMGVYKMNHETRTIMLVHSYGIAGGELKDHIAYFFYILSAFNVVFINADLSGKSNNFLTTCNQSSVFMQAGLALEFIDADFADSNYLEQIKAARNSYNKLGRKICHLQKYRGWVQMGNEHLKMEIEKEKIWFASRLSAHEESFKKAVDIDIPILFSDDSKEQQVLDWIANQDDFIEQTKKQLALIEVTSSPGGAMTFDLPKHLRRSKDANKARRDNYACLLMAAWGAKCFWDVKFLVEENKNETFEPFWAGSTS